MSTVQPLRVEPPPLPRAAPAGERIPVRAGAFLALVTVGSLVMLATWAGWLQAGAAAGALRAWLRSASPLAPPAFTVLAAISIGCGAPRLPFAVLGGAAFGALEGIALAQVATVLGCLVTFRFGRWSGQAWARRVLAERYPRFGSALVLTGEHPILSNLVLRAAPVGNCFFVNLLMSLTPMRATGFGFGTCLGTLPETVIYGLAGAGIVEPAPALWAGATSLFLLLCLGYWGLVRGVPLARTLRGILSTRGDA